MYFCLIYCVSSLAFIILQMKFKFCLLKPLLNYLHALQKGNSCDTRLISDLQGVPKKMHLLSSFELLTLGGVFSDVKNNSKNFGNKKKYWVVEQNFE